MTTKELTYLHHFYTPQDVCGFLNHRLIDPHTGDRNYVFVPLGEPGSREIVGFVEVNLNHLASQLLVQRYGDEEALNIIWASEDKKTPIGDVICQGGPLGTVPPKQEQPEAKDPPASQSEWLSRGN